MQCPGLAEAKFAHAAFIEEAKRLGEAYLNKLALARMQQFQGYYAGGYVQGYAGYPLYRDKY